LARFIQKIIKLTPIFLLVLLGFIDRNNSLQVIGFILLLFTYTTVLIIRILYARRIWHEEFNDEKYANDPSIKKMQDLIEKFDK